MWQKLGRRMYRATKDEAGQSLIILVVAFFALLVIIGLAVDLGLMYIERIKLGRACDAAALAASQDLPFEEFAARRAIQYLRENGYDPDNTELIVLGPTNAADLSWAAPEDSIGTITIDMEAYEDEDLKGTEKDNSADKIRVYGQVNVTTNFMQLIGFHTVPVEAQAIAENVSNLDIMLVYDESGSMNNDTYCYRNNDQDPCYIQGDNEYPKGDRLYLPFANWIGLAQQPVVYDDLEILVAEAEYFTYSTSYAEHPYYRDYYEAPGTFWMLQRVAHSQASGYRYVKDDRRGAHLMHMPHRSDILGHKSVTDDAPRLDYDFAIPESDEYVNDLWWVWIRAQCGSFPSAGARADSCVVHWGLNGTWREDESTEYGQFDRRSAAEPPKEQEKGSDDNLWTWVRLGSATMTEGSNVQVNIWGGGSGFRLDKILLTRNATGPQEPTLKVPDRAPAFIQETTPDFDNTVRDALYQTYEYANYHGGPGDTRGRTGMAIWQCNPIYGLRVNIGCTVGSEPSGSCVDLDGNGTIDVSEICDNTTDDIFDDQQPIRTAKEAAKGFLKRMRAGFDQVGFIGYSTNWNQEVSRELNCVKPPKSPQTYLGAPAMGIWDPVDGPDDLWTWCYDERLGPTGFDLDSPRNDNTTHGSIIGAIEAMDADGLTNISDGMREGIETIGQEPGHYGRSNAIKVMILLTDGVANRWVDYNAGCGNNSCCAEDLYQPNTGSYDEKMAADCVMYYAHVARAQGIVIYTIGLGQEADEDLLQAVADETNGLYYFAPKAQDLDYIFQLIADQIFLRLVE